MEENSTIPLDEFQYPPNFQIPFDLFISKKYESLGARGFLRFTDSAGNLVYTVKKLSHKSAAPDSPCTKLVLDSSGNTLFSIHRLNTSLMHKLGIKKLFIPRNRFRVTIFPGFADHGLVASLVVIYFDGRKLWR